ncbi:unnamed protein product, partial [Prorocentrum cordatum]
PPLSPGPMIRLIAPILGSPLAGGPALRRRPSGRGSAGAAAEGAASAAQLPERHTEERRLARRRPRLAPGRRRRPCGVAAAVRLQAGVPVQAADGHHDGRRLADERVVLHDEHRVVARGVDPGLHAEAAALARRPLAPAAHRLRQEGAAAARRAAPAAARGPGPAVAAPADAAGAASAGAAGAPRGSRARSPPRPARGERPMAERGRPGGRAASPGQQAVRRRRRARGRRQQAHGARGGGRQRNARRLAGALARERGGSRGRRRRRRLRAAGGGGTRKGARRGGDQEGKLLRPRARLHHHGGVCLSSSGGECRDGRSLLSERPRARKRCSRPVITRGGGLGIQGVGGEQPGIPLWWPAGPRPVAPRGGTAGPPWPGGLPPPACGGAGSMPADVRARRPRLGNAYYMRRYCRRCASCGTPVPTRPDCMRRARGPSRRYCRSACFQVLRRAAALHLLRAPESSSAVATAARRHSSSPGTRWIPGGHGIFFLIFFCARLFVRSDARPFLWCWCTWWRSSHCLHFASSA